MTATPTPLDHLNQIAPYKGGDSKSGGVHTVAKLSSNENPLGPSPRAVTAYQQAARSLHLYPDGGAVKLRDAIGEAEGLDPARIVCGAGSDELIALLCQCYLGPGDETLYSQHGFLMYRISTLAAGGVPVVAPETNLRTDVDAMIAAAGDKTKLVFIANPNNPTGSYLSGAEVRRLRDGLPAHTLLVVDEAYAEYVEETDYESAMVLSSERDDVVVTRTFSKIHGLAALRLGWAYCPPRTADALSRARGPFNTSMAAQEAGAAAILDRGYIEHCRTQNALWRSWLRDRLAALGLSSAPAAGNFLLVGFDADGPRTAPKADAFLREQGLIVRRMEGYGLPTHLRVSIGREHENRALVAALEAFAASDGAAA